MDDEQRESATPRRLDHRGVFRRVRALDALALNVDRRYREWAALDAAADPAAWRAACVRYDAAKREYERVRDIPYRLEER